jgi:hypothetical protein
MIQPHDRLLREIAYGTLTQSEVAHALGISRQAVFQRVKRAGIDARQARAHHLQRLMAIAAAGLVTSEARADAALAAIRDANTPAEIDAALLKHAGGNR